VTDMTVMIGGTEYVPKQPKPLLADAQVGWVCQLRNGETRQLKYVETTHPIRYAYEGNEGLTVYVDQCGKYKKTGDDPRDIISCEPLAEEGTAEWALYQMMQGKKVASSNGTVYWQDKDDNDLVKYTDGYGQIWIQTPYMFLRCVGASGWQLYSPQPQVEVGDWVLCVSSICDDAISAINEIKTRILQRDEQ